VSPPDAYPDRAALRCALTAKELAYFAGWRAHGEQSPVPAVAGQLLVMEKQDDVTTTG
jgi:hypothetical protein